MVDAVAGESPETPCSPSINADCDHVVALLNNILSCCGRG